MGAIANAIATNVAKLQPQVVRKDGKGTTILNNRLSRLLCIRPCPEMSTYDFLYKMASDVVYTSNAFAIIFYSDDFTEITRIQPVTVRSHRIFEDDIGNLFFRFVWDYDGKEYTVPYQSVIHIRARYDKKRFLGTAPEDDLRNSVDLLETTYDGIKRVIKNSASLRGYLKYNNFADDNELKQKAKEFQQAYMTSENEGGIASLDSTYDFHELTSQPRQIPMTQVSFFRDNMYRYYLMNEKILTSTYTENEWNSFYEQDIEPFAIQFYLEFTFKIFSEKQRGFGDRIIFTSNRLQYASLQVRASIGKDLFDRGAITTNEYRDLLYLEPINDGDERMISLNYVKVEDQSLYQTGKGNKKEDNKAEKDKKAKARIEEVCNYT